jgi:hypothetical protein
MVKTIHRIFCRFSALRGASSFGNRGFAIDLATNFFNGFYRTCTLFSAALAALFRPSDLS